MKHSERGEREIARLDEIWNTQQAAPKQMIIDETIYEELVDRYEDYHRRHGCRSYSDPDPQLRSDAEAEELRDVINNGKARRRAREAFEVAAFQRSGNDPAGMVLMRSQ